MECLLLKDVHFDYMVLRIESVVRKEESELTVGASRESYTSSKAKNVTVKILIVATSLSVKLFSCSTYLRGKLSIKNFL